MKRLLGIAIACITLFAPVTVFAGSIPAGSSAHMRPVLFHDRAPHAHVHLIQPHH